MNSLLLFTDGACKGNSNVATVQHAAGWGVAAVLGAGPLDEDGLQAPGPLAELCGLVITDPSHPHFLGATVGSNNTAELTAIGEAFKWLAAQCREAERAGGLEHLGGPVVLRYDSDYAAKSVTGEFNGKKNTALIARVRTAYAEAQSALASLRSRRGSSREHSGIRFVHVRGHSGHRWNEHADMLANRGLSCTLRPDGAAGEKLCQASRRNFSTIASLGTEMRCMLPLDPFISTIESLQPGSALSLLPYRSTYAHFRAGRTMPLNKSTRSPMIYPSRFYRRCGLLLRWIKVCI